MSEPAEDAPAGHAPPDRRAARVVGLSALAWLVMVGYGTARPSVESLYLEAFGSARLPHAWVGVAVAVALVVSLYNRAIARTRLVPFYVAACGVSAAAWAALLTLRLWLPDAATYLLYVLKDVYVVVLVELFWSFANTVFPLRTARWAYGLFCVMGSLGGVVANNAIGPLAARYGTAQLPWAMPALLLVTAGLVGLLAPLSSGEAPKKTTSGLAEGVRVVKRSRYLAWMFLLIAVVQVVITLIDYRFNVVVEHSYPDVDARTAIIGRVYAAIDYASIVLQVTTGLAVRFLGVAGTLLSVPVVLGVAIGGLTVAPGLVWTAISKVASKSLDYSWFRAAKELLYLPLPYREKTRGKAVVDILTYRVSKGAVSLLLLFLITVGASTAVTTALTFALLVVWALVTWRIARRYRALLLERAKSRAGEPLNPGEGLAPE